MYNTKITHRFIRYELDSNVSKVDIKEDRQNIKIQNIKTLGKFSSKNVYYVYV